MPPFGMLMVLDAEFVDANPVVAVIVLPLAIAPLIEALPFTWKIAPEPSSDVRAIKNRLLVSNRATSLGLRKNRIGSNVPLPVLNTDTSAPPLPGVAAIEMPEAFEVAETDAMTS